MIEGVSHNQKIQFMNFDSRKTAIFKKKQNKKTGRVCVVCVAYYPFNIVLYMLATDPSCQNRFISTGAGCSTLSMLVRLEVALVAVVFFYIVWKKKEHPS